MLFKCPGFDGISSNVLKRIGDVVASPISHIINLSFLNGGQFHCYGRDIQRLWGSITF